MFSKLSNRKTKKHCKDSLFYFCVLCLSYFYTHPSPPCHAWVKVQNNPKQMLEKFPEDPECPKCKLACMVTWSPDDNMPVRFGH